MAKLFKGGNEYYSRYYSQKGRRQYLGKLQKRVIEGYRDAEDLGVLEKSRFYGEDLNRLQNENYSHATKKQMEAEIKRIEKLFRDKKRTSANWLSRHQGRDAYELIKNFFDKHPDKHITDYSDEYDVFDEIEAELESESESESEL